MHPVNFYEWCRSAYPLQFAFPSHIVFEDVAVIHSFSLLNGFYEIPTDLGFTLAFKIGIVCARLLPVTHTSDK